MKAIAEEEGKTLDIESPMDKLESFFVKIVAHAREQKQRTSGAEAGTGISGFLADKPVVRQETILDRLVMANVKPEIPEPETSTTETVQPEPESSSNNELLQKLTKQKLDSVPLETSTTEKAPLSEKEEKPIVKKDILDELIGKKDAGQTEMTRPDKNQEEQ